MELRWLCCWQAWTIWMYTLVPVKFVVIFADKHGLGLDSYDQRSRWKHEILSLKHVIVICWYPCSFVVVWTYKSPWYAYCGFYMVSVLSCGEHKQATRSDQFNVRWVALPNGRAICNFRKPCNIDGLVQEGCNSIALAMKSCLSCTNPSVLWFVRGVYTLPRIPLYNFTSEDQPTWTTWSLVWVYVIINTSFVREPRDMSESRCFNAASCMLIIRSKQICFFLKPVTFLCANAIMSITGIQ